ncbi:hypothetical protein [Spirosoma spitsbergense]|uniref:hypothetical protein n=1 Tax=Spirosoma spitsbergense TaxID=431554 RepID=UPI0012F73812|nr:hypothetical protein [Spirosoma spitsbergense]
MAELQRRAITDMLLLEPAQTERLLVDAKTKCEQLTRLLKNAMEYQKAWGYGTLDLLSVNFLELRLLDAFTIKNRPEASPHDRFAHHLTDAIMYKRGKLSGFIKQVENTLQPAPAVPFDTAQEPEYDLWYINNDDTYAFAKLKELAKYLPTIEPFTKRVEWFYEQSRIWEIEPVQMGVGNRKIPNPEFYSHKNSDGRAVDKNGNRVEEIGWGLSYNNDEEKGILHKLYFLRCYRTHYTQFLNKPRIDFDQLKEKYATQVQTKRGKGLVLDWVTGEIRERQQLISDWITANPDRYGNPEIKQQLQNAAVLIEQELEGISAIKWESFYRTLQLDPFGLLWGLVEYKSLLEIEEPNAPAPSAPLEIVNANEPTQDKINAHMSRLANKQTGGLPVWELLDKLVDVQKTHYSPDRREYITKLYYAIKDLLTVDYYWYIKIVATDEAKHTITQVYERSYPNRVGPTEKGIPHISPISEGFFKTEYAGKTLEQLNQNVKATRSLKLDKYSVLRADEKSSMNWLGVGTGNEEGYFERKIDKLFEPVIYSGWDRITFEEFVETYKPVSVTVLDSLTPSPPQSEDTLPTLQPGFDTYIVEEHRARLMPFLINHYSNTTPEQCGFMLYALVKLTYLPPSALNSNQTALHRAMEKTLGSIGTRQALNTAISRLDTRNSSDEDRRNIADHAQRISQFLTPLTAE